ncbi:Calx-beta domain-containing protein [Actinoplanes sp. L3-i22]|uniref:Calx-beta domain-containing protein n=1 Tax=Actinoplanes sp. L3-i22 TaxID=2836373 RepID=UPI001C783F74|nr:Calx-beta domain-containing protein [Actinoplanes sp. L3-i22]BCY14071.1 hypothetical protein L3i22_091590 [Actinoplanes sp. L3-i22]
MRERPSHQPPIRLWAPHRFRLAVSIVAAAAAGLVPGAVVLPAPAIAAPGDIVIDADIEDNEDGTFTFQVRRVGPSTGTYTLGYRAIGDPTAEHPATPGLDFTAISGTTTFNASTRDVVKRLTVQGKADSTDEYDESFVLQLMDPTLTTVTDTAYGSMLDTDAEPTYTLGTPVTVGESDPAAVVTATLSHFSAKSIMIPYSTADGSATAGEDYTAEPAGALAIAPGVSSGTVSVPILPDALDETSPETFTVVGGVPTNATEGTPTTATVNITDDDSPPVVSVEAAPDAAEGDTLHFVVSLDAPSKLPVTVRADTSGGTASPGTDYAAVTNQTLTIPAGQQNAMIDVPTVADAFVEGQETVGVTLSSPVNATLGTASVTGKIVDNAITLTPVGTLAEGNSGTHVQQYDVNLTVAPQAPVSVGYTVVGDSATDGKDLDNTSGTLTFGVGEKHKTIDVTIHGDNVYEPGDETFDIALTNPGGAPISGFGTTPVTIPDDDTEPTLVSVSSISRPEGNGTATFVATLSNPSSQTVTVDVAATPGTATTGGVTPGSDDYTRASATLTFPAESIALDIPVTINADTVFETDESATISATPNAGVLGSTVDGTLTLQNDDQAPSVTLAPPAATEGDGPVTVTATVTGSAQASINWTADLTGGTAQGADFDSSSATLSGTLLPGVSSIALGTIAVVDDDIDEDDQTVKINVTLGSQAAVSGNLTIHDDPLNTPPAITMSAAQSVAENAASPLDIPVTLDWTGSTATKSEKSITVQYGTAPGTALAPGDYTTTGGTLTFGALGNPENIPVPLVDDSAYELSEHFDVNLSNATNATIAVPTDVVTINDNDPAPGFTVSSPGAVAEGGSLTYTVTLAAPAVADIHFTASMAGVTADVADYTLANSTFTIPAGETTATVVVQTTPDVLYEGDETATLSIARAGGENNATGAQVDRTVTITDDDPIPTLTLNTQDAAEGNSVDVIATVHGVAQAAMTFTVAAAGDSSNGRVAADVADYTANLPDLVVPANTTSGHAFTVGSIDFADDTIDEDEQYVGVTLSNATHPSAAPVSSAYGIDDDVADLPPLIVPDGTVSVAEDDGTATVPVTLQFSGSTTATEKTVSVNWSADSGTAMPDEDFQGTSGTMTFAAGQTSKSADVALIDDAFYELDETFDVNFSNPQGADVDPAVTTVTITDDDSANKPGFTVERVQPADGVTVITPGTPIPEGDSAVYKVELAAPAVADVHLDVTMVNGTTHNDDYHLTDVAITIPKGGMLAAINLHTTPDTMYEGDQTATLHVALAGSETNATGGPIDTAVTIADDDAKPTLSVSSNGGDEGGTAPVIGILQGSAEVAMTYTLNFAPSTTSGILAADPADFTATPATVVVPGGTASGSILPLTSVPVLDDDKDEDVQFVGVTVHNSTVSGVTDVYTDFPLYDAPDDLPPVIVAPGPQSFAEGVGTANVPVTLDFSDSAATSTEKTVTADWGTDPDTAGDGTDFTAATGTLTFAPGDTSEDVPVAIIDDAVYELSETFDVGLANASNASGIDPAGTTVTITDDDSAHKPVFSVSASQPVNEGGSTFYTVSLDVAAPADLHFTAAMADVTTSADDYTAPAGTFTIPKGQTSVEVEVATTADEIYEADETATLSIALAANEVNATGAQADRTVTITNDDQAPTLTLIPAEGAEGGTVAVKATVTGTAQSATTYSLTLAGDSLAGDPAEGADYTDSGLTFPLPPGTPSGTEVTLRTVPLLDDTVAEETEHLLVSVHNDTVAGVADVTGGYQITDDPDDRDPKIAIPANTPVAENDGPAVVPVTLDFSDSSALSTEKQIQVDYQTSSGSTDGSADAISDYDPQNGTLTFAPGETSKDIEVGIGDDGAYELDESFGVDLSNPQNSDGLVRPSGTVTITNDDTPAPGFTVSDPVVADEGDVAQYTITLDEPAAATVTFDATMADVSTHTAGGHPGWDDYTLSDAHPTIAKGETTATVQVEINNDDTYEADEQATLTVAPAATELNVIGAAQDRGLTIHSADAVPVIALNGGEGAEGGSLDVVATPTGVAENDLTYSLTAAADATNGADGAEPSDYTLTPGGGSFTLPAGQTAPLTVRTLGLADDTVDEVTETVKITATNTGVPAAGAVSALYRITDDPNDKPPAVALGGPVTVAEGAGTATVPVSLVFDPARTAATSTEQSVSVAHQTVAGTASANDYGVATPNPLVIAAGGSGGTISVPIVDDLRNEISETFQVQATAVTPADAAISTATSTITITDNDQNVPLPTFSVTGGTAAEGSGNATFTVALTVPAQDDVDLTVTTQNGTATGDDFRAPAGTLRIPMGSRTGTITVPIVQDAVYEGDESAAITVALAAGERDATGPAQVGSLTIVDDDARPTITLRPATGAEGETLELRGTVTGVAQRDLDMGTVKIAGSATGDPAEPGDYDDDRLGSLSLPGGTPDGTVVTLGTIGLVDDTVDEDTEGFTVTAGDVSADYRITDDPDDQTPGVTIADGSAAEDDGTVTLPVTLVFAKGTTGTERTVTLPWRTVAGTALADEDYTDSSGTLTFEPGTDQSTITVPIIDDKQKETDQSFAVRLGDPSPSDVVRARTQATVTIADNDRATVPTLALSSAVLTGSGRVAISGKAGAGSKVELLAAAGTSGGTFRVAQTTTADKEGAFTFAPTLNNGYRLMARADGLTSPVRTVQVRQDPALTATSGAKGAVTLRVSGDPDQPGQDVSVQRLVSGSWKTVEKGALNAAGTFTVTTRGLKSGTTYSFRAVIAATASLGILGGTSASRSVRVR